MKIKSENIADYIDLNYDINEFESLKELDKVEELVTNSLNYSLEVAPFYPKELSCFRNLKDCTFINFEITDEIIENLNKTSLKKLSLDNCKCTINNELNVERLYVEISNVNFKKIDAEELTILECGTIDINDLNKNIKELTLLNCNIVNSNILKNFKNCKIEIIGCTLDDASVKELENVKYDPNRYEKII